MSDRRRPGFPWGKFFRMVPLWNWCLLAVLAALGAWVAWDHAVRNAQPTLVDGVMVPTVTIRGSRGDVTTMSLRRAALMYSTVALALSWGVFVALTYERRARGGLWGAIRRPLIGALLGGLSGLALWAAQSAGPLPPKMTPLGVLIMAQLGALIGFLSSIAREPAVPVPPASGQGVRDLEE